MSATLSTDLLLRLAQATPEQQAAIDRFLRGSTEALSSPQTPPRAEPARFLFRRAGSHWRVLFAGCPEFYLEDTLGARYLDYLFHHPSETISAFDLEVAIQPEKAQARSRNSIQNDADPEATRAYLRELSRLRQERDQAAEGGRLAEADRLDGEIEALETALRAGCRSTDAGERARSNINKAVAVVRRRLAKGNQAERDFAEHINRFVSIGYQCLYALPSADSWD